LNFILKLFLILQQSSTINTTKMVQILEIIPTIVNLSKMKPIIILRRYLSGCGYVISLAENVPV